MATHMVVKASEFIEHLLQALGACDPGLTQQWLQGAKQPLNHPVVPRAAGAAAPMSNAQRGKDGFP